MIATLFACSAVFYALASYRREHQSADTAPTRLLQRDRTSLVLAAGVLITGIAAVVLAVMHMLVTVT